MALVINADDQTIDSLVSLLKHWQAKKETNEFPPAGYIKSGKVSLMWIPKLIILTGGDDELQTERK